MHVPQHLQHIQSVYTIHTIDCFLWNYYSSKQSLNVKASRHKDFSHRISIFEVILAPHLQHVSHNVVGNLGFQVVIVTRDIDGGFEVFLVLDGSK